MYKRSIYVMTVMLMILSSAVNAQELGADPKTNSTEKTAEDMYMLVNSLMEKGDMSGAEKLLLEIVAKMPSDWKPIKETDEKIVGSFFNDDDFISYSKFFAPKKRKEILWVGVSYSKAFQDLAYIAIERRDLKSALEYLDRALTLEPDQVTSMQEKAYLFARQGRYQEAYDLYMKSFSVRQWASDKQRAKALRGAGASLIDLGKLDESEVMFKRSLELEPGNSVALNELGYISDLKRKK